LLKSPETTKNLKKVEWTLENTIRGGLGNQIFQYLAGKYILENSGLHKQNLELSWFRHTGSHHPLSQRRPDLLELLSESARAATSLETGDKKRRKLFQFPQRAHGKILCAKENQLQGNPEEEAPLSRAASKIQSIKKNQIKQKIKLEGFWQDPRPYLDRLSIYSKDLEGHTTNRPSTPSEPYVSAHIRRGDYVKAENCALEYSSRFSLAQYITLALEISPQHTRNMPLVITTDDPGWCQKWLGGLSTTQNRRVLISESENAITDWLILKNSHLNIISNSTFSFTAAMLNTTNTDQKIRCIMPLWYSRLITVHQKGWAQIEGSLDL
jgi:hypothetical protein